MADWLTDALLDSGSLVTANRRLARSLREEYAKVQAAAGRKAWRSPDIQTWQTWLASIVAGAKNQESLPTRINAHQSQWLWERCLRRELGDSVASIANLVRLSRESWQRLADWRISITEVARTVQTADQRMFAAAAGRYLSILQREQWVDDAGLADLVLNLIGSGRVQLRQRYTFAGFERQRPIALALQSALRDAGSEVWQPEPARTVVTTALRPFASTDAELRSAGEWARRHIDEQPGARVAVIARGLEQDADRISRLFREGFVPGWQYGPHWLPETVNVSYGRKLNDYPVIAMALLLLRWLARDLASSDVGLLLRSPLFAASDPAGRSRLELRLRQLPDREWSPSMLTSALRGDGDGTEWLAHVAGLSKRRREIPAKASPAAWAVYIDETLRVLGWPGVGTQISAEFQLLNRWRELLNDFARLDLVSPNMTLQTALARLQSIASDTVFQAESTNAAVSLMGPLEASGAEFDALWISGLTAANWPPAGSPSALISRKLQREHGMPDSTPADTEQYARRVLNRLTECAPEIVCSFALQVDDAEQMATALLTEMPVTAAGENIDPGWNALRLVELANPVAVADAVPRVTPAEKIAGGAGTLQRQLSEPFSAFAAGRLGVKILAPQAVGIPASMRGNIIHDALHALYAGKPSRSAIGNWQGAELTRRIDKAVDAALSRRARGSGAVLQQLLGIERTRVARLLGEFVVIDRARNDFQIKAVEGELQFSSGDIRLALRFDRMDCFEDGSVAILDYKSGATKKLMRNREEANEIQLFVYATATEKPVAALALVNIDSREVGFNGAGRDYTDESLWPELLEKIGRQIDAACRDLEAGDVRVNIAQSVKDARPLNLLSRFTELRRDR